MESVDISQVIAATKLGGEIVRKYFGEVLEIEEKTNAGDLRTKADVESEEAIVAALQKAFPEFNIYAEESGQIDNNSDYTFVVDPLDGTNNFVLGIPDFAISVGLLRGSDPVLGVIYSPVLDRLYSAQKGKGAYLNGKPLKVNSEDDPSHITVSYTCGYNTSQAYSDAIKRKLRELPVKRILDTWAPAYDYCLLASGRIEAVISKEGDLEDYAAAKLIVTEAGGVITGFQGQAVDGTAPDFLATNEPSIHNKILELLV